MENQKIKNNECVIETRETVKPMIYGYITPGITYHDGYTKIGYTEQEVEVRIRQQTHTAGIYVGKDDYWKGIAIFEDGSWKKFSDKDFHKYLRKLGYKQPQELGTEFFDPKDINEWFKIGLDESKLKFYDFKENHGVTETTKSIIPYTLREEQKEAVDKTLAYKEIHEDGEFLWNAKPRFGKTLATYDFCIKTKAQNILIVTNRPAIAKSWFDDYEQFFGSESQYLFVSEVSILKGLPGVYSRQEYLTTINSNADNPKKCIEFVSLQDLKGSIYFGGEIDKLKEVKDMNWDILVIDEAHEGVDTYKTDVAFKQIKRKFTLHLSGTPFKALANDKFAQDAIFNWTYADEQKRKHDWDKNSLTENPYEALPELNMYTYQMSEIIYDKVSKGIDINGETVEYAFDLNEFFATNSKGEFVYSEDVDKFLDALTTQKKLPFSTDELRNEIKHSFWLLDRVDSVKALTKKLRNHPIFKDYEVIPAVGNGKVDDSDENEASLAKVKNAINNSGKKTITLSVGQLTTGVTIPEWTAVLMLSNCKSPALYMQAAFRAQNPCLFQNGPNFERKIRAYVFDFDPARTLTIYEEFANDLSMRTFAGRGTVEDRKQNINELLNFFPVIGEDENGEMILLDAEKVLSIPRKIKSKEVVKRGFMSDFLFANISHVFNAPKIVYDILEKMSPAKEEKNKPKLSKEIAEELNVDENGNINLNDEYVIGKATEIFGEKVYGDKKLVNDTINNDFNCDSLTKASDKIIKSLEENNINNIIDDAKKKYGGKMKESDSKQISKILKEKSENLVKTKLSEYSITEKTLDAEKNKELQNRFNTNKSPKEIETEYAKKIEDVREKLKTDLISAIDEFTTESEQIAVKTVETNDKKRTQNVIEENIRDHLRGFSRTIPAFLMAYGDNDVTLANFDTLIPDDVFKEVTSITKDNFRFLRDGGDYTDENTKETKHFDGHLFDEVAFNDSIKEFLDLKKKLANYFDESNKEDIFDYIPAQETNQIYTPKKVVKRMVDMLESENPGCFDDPNKTFIDLYMKSGLYITEIVKRIYNSDKIKKIYPDSSKRLKHIFEKQVYGLAPTEILYKIATNFILGFDEDVMIEKHNFKQLNATPYAKNKTLSQKLDEIYNGSDENKNSSNIIEATLNKKLAASIDLSRVAKKLEDN